MLDEVDFFGPLHVPQINREYKERSVNLAGEVISICSALSRKSQNAPCVDLLVGFPVHDNETYTWRWSDWPAILLASQYESQGCQESKPYFVTKATHASSHWLLNNIERPYSPLVDG